MLHFVDISASVTAACTRNCLYPIFAFQSWFIIQDSSRNRRLSKRDPFEDQTADYRALVETGVGYDPIIPIKYHVPSTTITPVILFLFQPWEFFNTRSLPSQLQLSQQVI